MKKSEAASHLRAMMIGAQRFRSALAEENSSDDLGDIYPYLFGEKCILPALSRVIDHFDDTGELKPGDFANLMYVAFELEPVIALGATIQDEVGFPEGYSVTWFRPWDPE